MGCGSLFMFRYNAFDFSHTLYILFLLGNFRVWRFGAVHLFPVTETLWIMSQNIFAPGFEGREK